MGIAERAYDLAVVVGGIASVVSIALVIPALFWKRFRRLAGWSLRITSYAFGTGAWLSCGINLGILWGFGGFVLGLSPAGLFWAPAVMLWHKLFKEVGGLFLTLFLSMVLYTWGTAWIAISHRQDPEFDELVRRLSVGE